MLVEGSPLDHIRFKNIINFRNQAEGQQLKDDRGRNAVSEQVVEFCAHKEDTVNISLESPHCIMNGPRHTELESDPQAIRPRFGQSGSRNPEEELGCYLSRPRYISGKVSGASNGRAKTEEYMT